MTKHCAPRFIFIILSASQLRTDVHFGSFCHNIEFAWIRKIPHRGSFLFSFSASQLRTAVYTRPFCHHLEFETLRIEVHFCSLIAHLSFAPKSIFGHLWSCAEVHFWFLKSFHHYTYLCIYVRYVSLSVRTYVCMFLRMYVCTYGVLQTSHHRFPNASTTDERRGASAPPPRSGLISNTDPIDLAYQQPACCAAAR